MRYKIYIKPMRKNLLNYDDLERGDINNIGEDVQSESDNIRLKANKKIPVKKNKIYQLMEIGYDDYKYWIYEYDDQDNIIAHSLIEIDVDNSDVGYKTFYRPQYENTKYIRIKIETNVRDVWNATISEINHTDRKTASPRTKNHFKKLSLRKRVSNFMFLESSDAILIHDSYSPEKNDHLLNVNLDLNDSAAGSLTFTTHPNHPYFKNKINLWTDTVYVTRMYKNGSERIIWDGRPINYEQIIDGITYYCEGALSYFNDFRVMEGNGYHDPYLDPPDLINKFILDYKNNSIYSDRMDRTFFTSSSYKIASNDGNDQLNLQIIDHHDKRYDGFEYIDIDKGYRNLWALRRESGLKWLNDICESYGAHMKILYDENDSPNDIIIARKLVITSKEIDKGDILFETENLFNWQYISKNDIFWDFDNGNKNLYICAADKDFNNVVSINKLKPGNKDISTLTYIELKEDDLKELGEKRIEVTLGSHIYIITIEYNHYFANDDPSWYYNPVTKGLFFIIYIKEKQSDCLNLHATFGIDIFDAKKVSEIDSFATKIIPRGAKCKRSIKVDPIGNNINTEAYQSSSDLEETNIFMNTMSAYFDGNYVTNNEGGEVYRVTNFKWYHWDDCVEDTELIKKYGLVEAVVDFEFADTPLKLFNAASKWFKELKKKIIKNTIDISLTDFGQLDFPSSKTYYFYTESECLDLWTQVYAYIPELGVGTENPAEHYSVVSLSIPLDDPLNTQVTLNDYKSMITDNVIIAGDIRGSSIGVIDNART